MKKGIILCVSLIVAAVIGITAWLLVPQKAQPAKGDMARVDGVFITGEQMHNAMEFNQIQMDTYERLFYKTYALEEDAKA